MGINIKSPCMSMLSTTNANSSSNISPAMRKVLPPDFPFLPESNGLLKHGWAEQWYTNMREEFVAHGHYYIREVIPGANQNKTQRLYLAVCAQFEAWGNDKADKVD